MGTLWEFSSRMSHFNKQSIALPLVILSVALAGTVRVRAAEETEVRKHMLVLSGDEKDLRKAAIEALTKSGEMRLIPFFKDFSDSKIYLWKGQLVYCADSDNGTALLDALTREPISGNPKADKTVKTEWKALSPMGRGEANRIESARSLLGLYATDATVRRDSVVSCASNEIESSLPALTEMLTSEQSKRVRFALEESIARLKLLHADGKKWTPDYLAAAAKLGDLSSGRGLSKLQALKEANLKEGGAKDAAADQTLGTAIQKTESWQQIAHSCGHIFSGISLGSVLVLMALGLSIIFGLMGVINMAHGELMMIGAYATFLTQKGFEAAIKAGWFAPGAFEWFFLAAIPLAFLASAVVGYAMERLVIRHLYGRPLDSLLATWGISLLLIQTIRLIFGDNNGVNSPAWLQGSVEIMQDVQLPYNRIFIIGFCLLCVLLMYLLINKTKLGLLLRATTQNRNMAASLGVVTRRIDGYTFALGAGLAGMAGCALTQIGGVTPDMGQNYIVDSFMVVVTGGVGKLAGAIVAGFGLGMTNKFLEAIFAAVWGKILILMCVVLFIQWRPSGLFPAKGRTADA